MVAAAVAVVALTWLWARWCSWCGARTQAARAFTRQGVRGPAYRFFVGNNEEVKAMRAATSGVTLDLRSHDFISRVMPHYRAWTSRYGKVFLSWYGSKPTLCVGDYDMVKRVLSDRSGPVRQDGPGPGNPGAAGHGPRSSPRATTGRATAASCTRPFAMDKLKSMTGTMAACAAEVIGAWAARAAAKGNNKKFFTIEVGQQFQELTADVISHTAFGSSFRQGKEVFLAQRELQFIAFASINNVRVPGSQYAPTKANVRRWQLERKVRGTLMEIIHERLAAAKESRGYGTDLLGLMLEANAAGGGKRVIMSMDEIIDECKTFFFAGHDTTSHLLTWAMFLLGTHPEWQQKLREEVIQECGGADAPIHGDALNKLKLVTMVLYETLRLYGAVIMVGRVATVDADLCGVKVPKGTILMIPIAMLHRDEEVWGADAGRVQPAPVPGRRRQGGRAPERAAVLLHRLALVHRAGLRHAGGQGDARHDPTAVCTFEVAPEYVHAPADFLTLQPMQGASPSCSSSWIPRGSLLHYSALPTVIKSGRPYYMLSAHS
ncbi:hypothetical protein PR202_ga17896 [Eleusine coracana subsp. coracana]|uniref:Uncharacterized protein n=1 Tax=Eleusine coracana subsp. coracana TaxID=191504 RepID=A0AAV5CQK4_ELECO|nr:hypothetical protein PR202_ga17896 [Eleusine coracana subsp. coracana]